MLTIIQPITHILGEQFVANAISVLLIIAFAIYAVKEVFFRDK